ncbi:MAG TPA: NAD-dependent epimerase/dehydratase family protein, partial [Candidatus Peregrinibacteria bacterium]|nr:NAD-dependent epimerase/dehydratase family protein [Candidatus Peregrinibacteria bacterium]
MKVLVTGGAGFIGSNLCNHLVKKKHQVVALDNLMLGKVSNLDSRVKFIKGSVEKEKDLEKCGRKIDYIIHLAAASSAPMFSEDLIKSYRNNVIGFLEVLEFARKHKIKKVIYASSSSIYGNNPTPLAENQSVVPPNFYAVTKHTMEETAYIYNQVYGLEIIGFRFMSVYGPNEKHKGVFANLVSQFIWEIEKDKKPVIYGDGKQRRDFTNVRDIVQAIELAIRSKKKFGATFFNIGTAKSYNLLQIIKYINQAFGKNIPVKHIKNPIKGYIRTQLASLKKISKELGYKPTT